MLHLIQDPWLSPRSAKSNPRKRSNGGGTGLNLSILNNMDVLRNKLLRELMARNQASSCNKTQFFLCRLIKKTFCRHGTHSRRCPRGTKTSSRTSAEEDEAQETGRILENKLVYIRRRRKRSFCNTSLSQCKQKLQPICRCSKRSAW